jgi:hypothetical protein
LKDEVGDALLEMLLRRLGNNEAFAGRLVLSGLGGASESARSRPGNSQITHELVDAILISLAVELFAQSKLSACVRLLTKPVLQLGTASETTRLGPSGLATRDEDCSDVRLSLQPFDMLLQPLPRLGSRSLELVLHRLQIAHEVGEVGAFLAQGRVLLNQSILNALRSKRAREFACRTESASRTLLTSRSDRRLVFS